MPLGAGKYDDLATYVREQSQAEGVAVIVVEGNKGSGISVQASAEIALRLPYLLRMLADSIEDEEGHA